jgi:hypothetical protein
VRTPKLAINPSGTGDLFASLFVSACVCGSRGNGPSGAPLHDAANHRVLSDDPIVSLCADYRGPRSSRRSR